MAGRDKEPHQPEPWSQDGRYILDAGQWTLASTKFPADARRIVASVNAVRGIPTEALESWVVNVIGNLATRRQERETPTGALFPRDQRVGERRRGDRRSEIRIWAGDAPQDPADAPKGQTSS